MRAEPLVRVVRSGVVESVHAGSVAVSDAGGTLVAWAGDPGRVAFVRSAMKPVQAAASLSLIGDDLTEVEVAVMCASHNGESAHVEAVRRILGRAGLGVDALRCPPALPLRPDEARRVPGPAPELHNCSGKHAGMLLASVRSGEPPERYTEPDHPVQRSVLEAVTLAAGSPRTVGVDGCGVPVHALPLDRMAAMYARLARPEGLGDLEAHVRRATSAMRAEPYMVGGAGRLCTEAMEAAPEILVKVGAEGLVCAAVMDAGLGVAVKLEDGAERAQGPAILRALAAIGAIEARELDRLREHARPEVLGGGQPVGELSAAFDLRRP